jgi:predicted DCC family thiol-disulfide oxidoreductase YuxK
MATEQPCFKILVLGGYGNFGKRICASLASEVNTTLIIAGRNLAKAEAFKTMLLQEHPEANLSCWQIDITDTAFAQKLAVIKPDLVIHTSGPFQGQAYDVPRACLEAGCHYIDLADDRRYVCDISSLNEIATSKKLLLVTGASSVPGISSAVLDHYQCEFSEITHIDFGIAPGNKLERGVASIAAILSYTGHPFKSWRDGEWINVYGWMNSTKHQFPKPIGNRRLANVDIPDLELFPKRYAPVKSVSFKAGLELGILHNTMVGMAWLCKIGLVKNWQPLAGLSKRISEWFYQFGTDDGAMYIRMEGIDKNREPKIIEWNLIARNGVGPNIPTIPAILLARKLIHKESVPTGAMPCLGLLTKDEVMAFASTWGIYEKVRHHESRIKVYYNSACPVCKAGIAWQQEKQSVCEMQWNDVHTNNSLASEVNNDIEFVRKRLHVIDENEELQVGFDAFLAIWRNTPTERWKAKFLGLPVIKQIFRIFYNVFAAALYQWNKTMGHW